MMVLSMEGKTKKVYLIPMVHNNDVSNFDELRESLHKVLRKEGTFSLGIEFPSGNFGKKFIDARINLAAEGRLTEQKSAQGLFSKMLFEEFMELRRDGVDINPIDLKLRKMLVLQILVSALSSDKYLQKQNQKTATYTLNDFERTVIKENRSLIGKMINHRILGRRNKAMLKNIIELVNDRDNPVVVMVGAMHSPYLEAHLKQSNIDVVVDITNNAKRFLDIELRAKDACSKSAKRDDERMWITRRAIIEKVMIVDRDNVLSYIDEIWSLKTRKEAIDMFNSLKTGNA